MSLEHRPDDRLTPEQRDRVLDLAARLQARHETTVAIDDLAKAASEAGIEARFVHEAAQSLVHPLPPAPQVAPASDRTVALSLIGSLALLNALASLTPLREIASSLAGLCFVVLAAVSAYWSVRGKLTLWATPAAVLATLLGTRGFLALFGGPRYDSLLSNVVTMMMFEIIASFLAGLATAAVLHFRVVRRIQP